MALTGWCGGGAITTLSGAEESVGEVDHMAEKQRTFATPLGTASQGRVEFARGASRVTIGSDGEMPDLLRARFESVAPMVLADDGRVTIEYPRISPSEWLHPNRRAADIVLNGAIPWELVFGGGVSRLRADLRGLALSRLDIAHGASDLEVVLPKPEGVTHLRVGGGASDASFRRPAGVAVAVSVAGGSSRLTLDNQGYPSIGGATFLSSPNGREAADRYEIEIGGGASDLTITESDE